MTAADTDSGVLISERVAGGILPKVLTTFDMVAIFVAIVLFITNSAVVQSVGVRLVDHRVRRVPDPVRDRHGPAWRDVPRGGVHLPVDP
jgi:hypothetical protein